MSRKQYLGDGVYPRYVYVVEQGCYSNRGIIGVYDSPESAMADNPITKDTIRRYPKAKWEQKEDGEIGYWWSNGCDWDDAVDITRFEVQSLDKEK